MKNATSHFPKWTSNFESEEQAIKAKRFVILELLAISFLHFLAGLLFWWIETNGDVQLDLGFSATFSALIFAIFAALLYFYNSRLVACAFLLFAILETVNWSFDAINTENFNGLEQRLLLMFVATQTVITFFKLHRWRSVGNRKLPKSSVTHMTLVAVLIFIAAGLLLPPMHFIWYTTTKILVTENENILLYQDFFDRYDFSLPNYWNYENVPLKYGAVNLQAPGDSATIEIERWTPWDVPASSLFHKDKFLSFAQSEAIKYSEESGATVESVEMTQYANLEGPRVVYIESDGTKRYVYYIYNQQWSRETSDSPFFFWRMTAVIPKGFHRYEKDVELIASSFKVHQGKRE